MMMMASYGDLSPSIQCISCCALRSSLYLTNSTVPARKTGFRERARLQISCPFRRRRGWVACQGMTELQPESNDGKEKESGDDETSQPSDDSLVKSNGHLDPKPIIGQIKDESVSTELPNLEGPMEKNDGDPVVQDSILGKDDDLEVAGGSPLPGMKQLGEPIMIPKATIDILKDQVFGFDTFFVTSQEPYEGGVLFKGNLRGKASQSYEKIAKRLKDRLEDQYKLFLLINPEDDKPVAVVVPRKTLQPESTAVPEWFAATAFGLVTIFTLLLRNTPALQSDLLSTFDNLGLLKDGLPGALVTVLVIGIHEVGHILVARDIGVKLGVPYFVPSWQIGSFGAITRITSIVPNREGLLKLAAAGPLAGFSLGFFLLLLGFILPPIDGIGTIIDPGIFHTSFILGGIAKFLLGDALKEGTPLSVNPLVLWAWTGLLINAINSIPAGELDGGRISFALWGRKASTRLTGAALALLGISSLLSDVAFYWAALIFFLQRGPIAPLSEEITEPDSKYIGLGVAALLLGLLVCLPYPFPFSTEGMGLDL